MSTPSIPSEEKRIEFRVSQAEKDLYDKACALMGFKSFSEFARYTLQREAQAIITTKHTIALSERDQKLFFETLMQEDQPVNAKLQEAVALHRERFGA
jgi:uncharacterized protein (DUF1778 family)